MTARSEETNFDILRRSNPPGAAARAPAPYSIVLVEDEGSMGQVTQLLLESCGYEVAVAADGAQGLRLIRALAPNLVICDVNMPGLSGLDVLRALRHSDTTRHIPVIFLSGFITDEQRKDAQDFGVSDFLVKPCAFEEMKRVIAEYRAAAEVRAEKLDEPIALSA